MATAAPGRATLDFFGAQRDARRRTAALVLSFAAAVALVVLVVYAALLLAALWLAPAAQVVATVGGRPALERAAAALPGGLLRPGLLAAAAAVVGAVVGLGSAWHAASLGGGGGEALAVRLGGRRVDRSTRDAAELRLVNVAEEMAVAAGLPVPALYVLDREPGLNAFAAGDAPGRAVVAVTRGALERLTRDQLQGVVAHELGHVLNGDTRLDVRLLALVGGLGILALLGRVLLRFGTGSRERSGLPVGLVGLALFAAGSVGVLAGKLVRFAVARQREWLADACAVQFTRNPDGLAGALRAIAEEGGAVRAPLAHDAAHLFFARGVDGALDRLLSTHPPIAERIRRLQPHAAAVAATPAAAAGGSAAEAGLAGLAPRAAPAPAPAPPEARAARAAGLIARLPSAAVAAAREPFGARALCCALVLDAAPEGRARQLALLERDAALHAEVARLAPALPALGRTERMGLLALLLPALDQLAPPQAEQLGADLRALGAPRTPFGLAVRRVVSRRLEGARRRPGYRLRTLPAAPRPGPRSLDEALPECLGVLAPLAWLGGRTPAAAQAALDAGARALGVRGPWRLPPAEAGEAALRRLDEALSRLEGAAPAVRGRALAACAAAALADGQVNADEAELLRAVAAALGLPMPHRAAAPGPSEPAAQAG